MTAPKQYRIDVNIVDDHTLFAESLAEALNRVDTLRVSRTFDTLQACQASLANYRPDVLLLDISMPDGNGIVFCEQIMQEYPRLKVIAITIHDEYSIIQRTIDAGVHGYLLKTASIDELVKAIHLIWQGQRYVSPQVEAILSEPKGHAVFITDTERNILSLLCEGYTNPEIAKQLYLSPETVNWYRKRMLSKFGVKNTVSLVSLVIREKIL